MAPSRPPTRIEWPTWGVVIAVHAGWLALTLAWARLPAPLILAVGGYLLAWHGSLQHETIHGHPTRSRRMNAIVGGFPLALWLPYGIYRDTHLQHHAASQLADPREDPESMHVSREEWTRSGPVARACLTLQTTLVGRLLLGPFWVMARLFRAEARRLSAGDFRHLQSWGGHLLGASLVLAWLRGCHVPLGGYLILCVYPGVALTLLRSFAEHRVESDAAYRTAIVEAELPLALLYLNNNLHVVHHARPGVPWYQLPSLYTREKAAILAQNGGFYFRGYRSLLLRYGIRPKDHPATLLL